MAVVAAGSVVAAAAVVPDHGHRDCIEQRMDWQSVRSESDLPGYGTTARGPSKFEVAGTQCGHHESASSGSARPAAAAN